jgi:methylmalonyl-CoA/ethylmalonyl-CoA epimerase
MRRGSGLHHVAYAVSDVRSASSILRQGGLRVLYDAPRAGTRGSQINFVHPKDTGGVLLELVEHAAADRQNG